ncbi:hypothetical protein CHELA1G2_10203 [Hyphomicrobiales bacterium]|nr:hypothetical protein CHELA1G2_10203 [Hyphomicrobiales bacterium]
MRPQSLRRQRLKPSRRRCPPRLRCLRSGSSRTTAERRPRPTSARNCPRRMQTRRLRAACGLSRCSDPRGQLWREIVRPLSIDGGLVVWDLIRGCGFGHVPEAALIFEEDAGPSAVTSSRGDKLSGCVSNEFIFGRHTPISSYGA